MLLKDKTAIVTGGTRGIGRAITMRFVKEGCKVAFTYSKSRLLASAIMRRAKRRAVGYQVDIRRSVDVSKFVKDVRHRFGRLDILVNNAGIVQDKPLMMMDRRDWDEIIDTNLSGAFNCTRSCISTFMRQKNGNIINIASLSGIIGIPGQANYAASKAGLIGFTRSLAKEAGPYEIRVNAIAPGFIETDMTRRFLKGPFRQKMLDETPLRRFGSPDEVAELALFLASKRSSFITGQVLIIDGGVAS